MSASALVLTLVVPVLAVLDVLATPSTARWVAWFFALGAAVGVFAWQGWVVFRRRALVEIASDLERRAGIGGGLLAAGAAFSQRPPRDASTWMINRTVALAEKAAADIHTWPTISPLPRGLPLLALALSASLMLGALVPTLRSWLARAVFPGSAIGRPGELRVTALGGDRFVPVGSEPELTVLVTEGMPSQVTATITWNDGRSERRPLFATGEGRWHLTLPPVTGALTWQVEANRQPGGPARGESDRQRIGLTPGLVPTNLQLRVIPPAYTHLPSQTATGDCAAVAGSQIELEALISAGEVGAGEVGAAVSPRLVAATIVIEPDDGAAATEVPATITNTTLWAQWTVRRSQRWGLRLIAGGGSETLPNRRWHVLVASDLAPKIQLTEVPATWPADAQAVIGFTAEDDVALAETVIEVRRDHASGSLLSTETASGDAARQRQSVVTVDGAALGLRCGDTVALIPVATDRAGQTTRGESTLVTVTADGAGWNQLANLLARVDSAAADARTALPALSDAWDRCGVEPVARTILANRLTAWRNALTAACRAWAPLANTPADREARHAVADLSWWSTHAISDLVTELTEMSDVERDKAGPEKVGPEKAAPLQNGRMRFTIEELRLLTASVRRSQEFVAHTLAVRALEADALAAHHHASTLLADLAWQTHPQRGLSATFSADADNAALIPGGVELPAVTDRDLPGLGHDHIRIRWQGAILVPRTNAVLELTADDGVALTCAGSARLPADAWNDHASTTWNSGPLPGGWQPLVIDWRQGVGGSLLRVAWAGAQAPLTGDELRAVSVPDWLMVTDATAIVAHTKAGERSLRNLTHAAGEAAQTLATAMASHRDTAWTAEQLAQALALADQVAGQQSFSLVAPGPSGPLAVALTCADRALDRARAEPVSPTGQQAVAVAMRWLAHAADAAGEEPGADSKRLRREVARITALGAKADSSAEIRQVETECDRLRKSLRTVAEEPEVVTDLRSTAILAGRDHARTAVAVACGTLALELRESVPMNTTDAEAIEALEARLRQVDSVSTEPTAPAPLLMNRYATVVAEVQSLTTHLVDGAARDVATVALAQAPAGPTDNAARRLASAIAVFNEAGRRLGAIVQRPTMAPPELADVPVPLPVGVTDAGFARAHLQAPTLNDRGIDGFRPDQQSAIRAYLARMRQNPVVTP